MEIVILVICGLLLVAEIIKMIVLLSDDERPEEYLEEDNADILDLLVRLQEALTEDSFLSALFQKEQSSVKMQNKMVESMVAES